MTCRYGKVRATGLSPLDEKGDSAPAAAQSATGHSPTAIAATLGLHSMNSWDKTDRRAPASAPNCVGTTKSEPAGAGGWGWKVESYKIHTGFSLFSQSFVACHQRSSIGKISLDICFLYIKKGLILSF